MKIESYLSLFICFVHWKILSREKFFHEQRRGKNTFFSPSRNQFPQVLFITQLELYQLCNISFSNNKKQQFQSYLTFNVRRIQRTTVLQIFEPVQNKINISQAAIK